MKRKWSEFGSENEPKARNKEWKRIQSHETSPIIYPLCLFFRLFGEKSTSQCICSGSTSTQTHVEMKRNEATEWNAWFWIYRLKPSCRSDRSVFFCQIATRLYGEFRMIHNAEFIIKIEHFPNCTGTWHKLQNSFIPTTTATTKSQTLLWLHQVILCKMNTKTAVSDSTFVWATIIYCSLDLMRYFLDAFGCVRFTTCIY